MQDLWLVMGCRRGDPDAQAGLYRRYYLLVFRTALHFVRDRSLAEDITQEAFISVFQEIHRLRTPGAFRVWLYRVVVGRVTRYLRAHGGERRPLSLDLLAEQGALTAPPAEHEEQIAVREAVAALPEELRLVVLLHYFSGLSVGEAAGVLCIPPGTVKSRLHTARARLAAILQPIERSVAIKEMSV